MKYFYLIVLLLYSLDSVSAQIQNSIFSQGEWYKIQVHETGIYKIDGAFLRNIGVDIDQIDPNTIQLFGHGGQALELVASTSSYNDPPEVSVMSIGFDDGHFDSQDYLLFYAQSSEGYQEQNKSFLNPYQDATYYYLTHSQNNARQVVNIQNTQQDVSNTYYTYNDTVFYEEDNYNVAAQGRRWFSDRFDAETISKAYDFQLGTLSTGTEVELNLSFAVVHTSSPQFSVSVFSGGNLLSSGTVPNLTSYNTNNNAYNPNRQMYNVVFDAEDVVNRSISVQVDYNTGNDINSELYVDYIAINTVNDLQFNDEQVVFSNQNTLSNTGVGAFQIAESTKVTALWDISDLNNVQVKSYRNQESITFTFDQGVLRRIVAVGNDYFLPNENEVTKFSNQDLKGTILTDVVGGGQDLDYLILAPSGFSDAANQLVDFHRNHNGLSVKWVDIQRIYNEFSSGKQDVSAIRNFVRYVYLNASSSENRLKYVCILGDGSYDYKDRIVNNTNYVPLYHSLESSSLTHSFATDDFYVMVDDGEGAFLSSDDMDISVGRILCRSNQEASAMINKIKSYTEQASFSDWRNNLLFVSDDVDETDDGDASLQEKILEISSIVEQKAPRANVRKLLIDAFEQVNMSGGERYPEARTTLESYFNQGVSLINYFGHGNEDGITSEYIFNSDAARSLTNDNYPVFVTLTCELTKFDNPDRITAGEYLFWNRNGGAIALVTTTRLLFLSVGEQLNDAFVNEMFDEQGDLRSIGDIVRMIKNQNTSANARTVFCIGDPYIKPPLPTSDIKINSINGLSFEDWDASGFTLKALDRVVLEGNIIDKNTREVQDGFDGEATLVLFDKNIESTTLGNDGATDVNGLVIQRFNELGNTIFRGKATVESGAFQIEFLLPKNIDFDIGQGKVSVYAVNNEKTMDVSGASNLLVGGLNYNAQRDDTPPSVELYLNDAHFYSGQLVGNSPLVHVKVTDDNGINTSGGVGHDIVVILDEDTANPIVLNQYYTADIDDFTKGALSYQLVNLNPGEHTLELRISDTYNNVASQEINFRVGSEEDFLITNVLSYPNPCVSYTEFSFTHTSVPNDVLEVTLQLMTLSGQVIAQQFVTFSGANSYTGSLNLDVQDNLGNKLAQGVYLYNITVKSTILNQISSKIQRLVVL